MSDLTKWRDGEVRANNALTEVGAELRRAVAKFRAFNTPHEGYAVVLEELDELWEVVRQKNVDRSGGGGQDKTAMRHEACQVAAMAIRFMVDLT